MTVYTVTANAGGIILLFGCTVLVFLVQEDFSLAGSYADFLRSSNVAFLEPVVVTTPPERQTEELNVVQTV